MTRLGIGTHRGSFEVEAKRIRVVIHPYITASPPSKRISTGLRIATEYHASFWWPYIFVHI